MRRQCCLIQYPNINDQPHFFSHCLSLSLGASWTCWFLWSSSKYLRLGTCKEFKLSSLLKSLTFIGPSFKSGIDGSWKKCSKIIELNRKINLSIEGCWVFHQTWHWWKLKKCITDIQTCLKSQPLDGFCLLRQSRMETSVLWRLGKVGGGAGTQTSSPYSLMRKTTGHSNLYYNLFYSILVIFFWNISFESFVFLHSSIQPGKWGSLPQYLNYSDFFTPVCLSWFTFTRTWFTFSDFSHQLTWVVVQNWADAMIDGKKCQVKN